MDLRFSDRVDAYVAGRPGYPAALVAVVREALQLDDNAVVADIGAGTGLLSRTFLDAGHPVYGVEPDAAMAAAAARMLGGQPRWTACRGSAENTGLDANSADLYTAGQAFHWFDAARAREEALRILRGQASVALVWNERPRLAEDSALTPFLADYESLVLEFDIGTYRRVADSWSERSPLDAFFGGAQRRRLAVPHVHRVTREGLVARASSCSYLPGVGQDRHAEMVDALDGLFARYADGERVDMVYRTVAIVGWLG